MSEKIHNPYTGSTYILENGKIVETIKKTKTKEQIKEENKKFFNNQVKRHIREYDKLSNSEKMNLIKKEIELADFRIEQTDKVITMLYKQQEEQIKWRNKILKMKREKDFEGFKREMYKLI